jgi:hypothetical protein
MMRRRKAFFFVKKKKKAFMRAVAGLSLQVRDSTSKSFLVLFYKKEHSFLG